MSGPIVLGFETSCDETGVAVIEGLVERSSVLASQVEEHARFGGVVPEVAARAHVEAIRPLTHQAITLAGIHPNDIDAVAVTRGPGLTGSLMVGFSFAKSFAYALGKPLYGVDHMEGHLFAPRLSFEAYEPPAVVILSSSAALKKRFLSRRLRSSIVRRMNGLPVFLSTRSTGLSVIWMSPKS